MIVGLPYSSAELQDVSEVRGGSPYGAATIAGTDGGRMPSEEEKTLARDQGARVAEIAAKLHGLRHGPRPGGADATVRLSIESPRSE